MVFWNDLKYGVRLWLARPAFVMSAIAALAIGIGANVAVFSVARALVLAPVRGIESPERLVEIGRSSGNGFDTISYPALVDIAAQSKSLEQVFGFSINPLNVRSSGDTRRALGLVVTENYFEALGVRAGHGRLLSSADTATVREAPIVVASHSAFERWFAGDPAQVGRIVSINGKPYTLVGVAPPEFRGHIAILAPDFYVPVTLHPLIQPSHANLLASREAGWLLAAARLAPGATLDAARTELSTITKRLRTEYPAIYGERFVLSAARLRSLPGEIAVAAAGFSGVMGLLVVLVLLIACVNVAGMLIARGEARASEFAMRYALGASRARVIGQSLVESAALALVAGVIGVGLAWGATRLLSLASLPTPFPLSFEVGIDHGVLFFALAMTSATALLFGLLPAMRVSGASPRMSSAGRAAGLNRGGTRLRSALVVGQVALSMLLLVAAGLFMRALSQSREIDPGFRIDGLLTADLDLEPTGYDPTRAQQLAGGIAERAAALPGVESAALVRVMPLTLSTMSLGGVVMGPGQDGDLYPDANVVSPRYFETMATTLHGREFTSADTATSSDVAIINQRLAARLFGSADALGRTLRYGDEASPRTLRVVGVAANGKYNSLWEDPKLAIWLPVTQWPTGQLNLVLATKRAPGEIGVALRGVLAAVDRDLPVPQVHPMRDVMALSLLPQRIASAFAGSLGAVAALLAAIGLYGLIAYQVAVRRREIGVRLALGASPRRIGSELARGAGRLVAFGVGIGLLLSLGLARIVATQLYGASVGDAFAFAGGALVLVMVAFVACIAPVRRATNLAPIEALRDD